jgi:restriction system protein
MLVENYTNCKELSLNQWLELIATPVNERKLRIIDYQFPTNELYEEYINTIVNRTDQEIKLLLKSFLIDAGHLDADKKIHSSICNYYSNDEAKKLIDNSIFLTKMFSMKAPWASIHWVIDLLPHHPDKAIQTLESYYQAHCQFIPDGRSTGLFDSIELIRLKYIKHYLPVKETLLNLSARDFELLSAYLYFKKDYEIKLTPKTRDGGYDILAIKTTPRKTETIYIECKRYSNNIGVSHIRKLLGTLIVNNATTTVFIATTYFTKPAEQEARASKRLELLNIEEFDYDMRKYVDYNWVYHISNYINESKKTLFT